MPSPDARDRLALAQAAVIETLLGRASRSAGFDAERVAAAARALASKRSRAVAKAWSLLAQALGGSFAEVFAVYAKDNMLPERSGPLADGRAFARHLAARGQLPEL